MKTYYSRIVLNKDFEDWVLVTEKKGWVPYLFWKNFGAISLYQPFRFILAKKV